MEGQAFALQGLGHEAMPDCGERWEMLFLPGGLCPGVSGTLSRLCPSAFPWPDQR